MTHSRFMHLIISAALLVLTSLASAASLEPVAKFGSQVGTTFLVVANPKIPSQVLSVNEHNEIHAWDLETKKNVWSFQLPSADPLFTVLQPSSDGLWYVAASFRSKCLVVLRASSGEVVRELCADSDLQSRIESIAVSNDGRLIAAGESLKPFIHLWSSETGKYHGKLEHEALELPGPITPAPVEDAFNRDLEFSVDSKRLTSVSTAIVRIFDVEHTKYISKFSTGGYWPERTLIKVAISPDMRLVVAAIHSLSVEDSENSGISILLKSTETGKQIYEVKLPLCKDDVRHVSVKWNALSTAIVCGNGNFYEVSLISGLLLKSVSIGETALGTVDDLKLYMAKHTMTFNYKYFVASGLKGIQVWELEP